MNRLTLRQQQEEYDGPVVLIPELGRPYRPLDYDVMPAGLRIELTKDGLLWHTYHIEGLIREKAMRIRQRAIQTAQAAGLEIWIVAPSKANQPIREIQQ